MLDFMNCRRSGTSEKWADPILSLAQNMGNLICRAGVYISMSSKREYKISKSKNAFLVEAVEKYFK